LAMTSGMKIASFRGSSDSPGFGFLRIPMDGDQRSELMSITIPK